MALIQKPPGLLVPSQRSAPDLLWWVDAAGRNVSSARFPQVYSSGSFANGPYGLEARCNGSTPVWGSTGLITTSDGAGTGDFTMLVVANPTAAGTIGVLLGQIKESTITQAGIYANCSAAGSGSSGSICLFTYGATGGQGLAVASKVDGRYHVWAGRRGPAGGSLWQDGKSIGENSGFLTRDFLDGTQRLTIGGRWQTGSTYDLPAPAGTGILLAASWNRALSDGELATYTDNPWLLFERRRKLWVVPSAATGGAVSLDGTGSALTLAGGTATLAATANIWLVGVGAALTLAGGTATLADTRNIWLEGTGSALTLAGGTATLSATANVWIEGTGSALTLAGGNATFAAGGNVSLDGSGSALTLSGGTATANLALVGAGSALTLSGGTATLTATDNYALEGVSAALTLVGGEATLTAAVDVTLAGEGSALNLVGGNADFSVTSPQAEQATGGWQTGWSIEFAREQRRLKREEEERKRELAEIEAEEKAELAREIAALETHLVDEGALEKVSRETELLRLRDLAASFDALPNRAQRALDYAERAKTEAALILAQREMQRLAEEEEMAVVLMLAMMD